MATALCPRCERVVHLVGDDARFCPVCATALAGPPDDYRPDLAADRIAKNEVIAREANDRIREGAAHGAPDDEVMFACECGHRACSAPIRLSLEAHQKIRENDAWFVTVPGHDIIGLERVIDRSMGYQVVEKLGPARQIAEGVRQAR